MGARPIAVLDALRFGDPSDPRTRHLVDGVVRGVGGYGNCVGVPDRRRRARLRPVLPGQSARQRHGHRPARGADLITGRGARARQPRRSCSAPPPAATASAARRVLASATFAGRAIRPSGPASRSATLRREAADRGEPRADRARARGRDSRTSAPAGITCATSETADRAGTGILLDLDAIPRREPGMAPLEVMISESQERMLAIVRPDELDAVARGLRRAGACPIALVGRVTADGDMAIVEGGIGAERSAERRRPGNGPDPGRGAHQRGDRPPAPGHAADPPPPGAGAGHPADRLRTACRSGAWTRARCCAALLGSPNLASRRWVYEQYDATRPDATRSTWPGHGAAVLRVKGTREGARGHDRRQPDRGRPRSVPRARSSRVAEATRNVSITGARPLGVTNCLNFGNPERPGGVLAAPGGGARPGRRVPGARRPGHRRQRLPLQRVAGRRDRADARDRRRRPARRRRDAGPAAVPPPRATRSCSLGEAHAGPGRLAPTRHWPGRRRRMRLRPSIWRAKRRCSRSPRGHRSRPRGLRPGRVRRRPGRRARRMLRSGAASARQLRLQRLGLAGRRAVRREPVASSWSSCRPRHAAAIVLLARQFGLPATSRHGRRRSAPHRAGRPGRDGRGRGTRLSRRRRAGRVARPTCATPGTTAWPAALGGADARPTGVLRTRTAPATTPLRPGQGT